MVDPVTKVRALIVGGAAASLLAVAAPASALGPTHHQTERAAVPGKVTALVVRGEVGNITVVPGTVTRIVAREQWNLEQPKLVHTLHDGELRVSAPCPRPTGIVSLGLNNCSVDFVMTVPRSVTVDARDSVGDVLVRGLRGAESLHSDVGSVVADGVVAPALAAAADSGTVRLADVRAGSLTLRSSSGAIRADLASMPNRVVARSSDGDVELSLPAGVYALDLHTDVGSTHVHGITVHSDARRTVSAHTDDGDIRITGR